MMTNRRWFVRISLALLALCLAPLLHAEGRAECSVIKSSILDRPVRYCAFLPESFDQDKTRRFPVLYYLHGLGDNEQSLLNLGGWDVIAELRREGKIGDFIVLAPSAGRTFYLNSENGKIRYDDDAFDPLTDEELKELGWGWMLDAPLVSPGDEPEKK